MQDFRSLDVWRKAHSFTLKIYTVTETFPKIETFGLAASLRKGSASVAMKIAEGCGQAAEGTMATCLKQARAVCMDVDYQLLLSHDLHFMETVTYQVLQDQLVEVRRMLSGLLKAVPV
jgi:four helix bundle protein